MFLAGLAYGAIGDDVGDLIGDSETSQEMFVQGGGDLVGGFYGDLDPDAGLICCGFAISSALRPRAEEDDGQLEVLLATALPRRRWLLGHVAVTVGGTSLVLFASGLRVSAPATCSSPATATQAWDAHLAGRCSTSRRCWCSVRWPGCCTGSRRG